MKVKHLGRKIISLFLALAMMIPLALPTFALGTTNFIGGGGTMGTTVNGNTQAYQGADGIRVTLVEASSGKRVSGTKSVDYSMATDINGKYYCDYVSWYFGMNCKSDYVKNNESLSPSNYAYEALQPGVNADEFAAIGDFIDWGAGGVNMKAIW